MFTETPQLYDLFYSSLKDYPAEAVRLSALLSENLPACDTILDVACGTGEHARLLAQEHGFSVDGLDLLPEFVGIAAKKHPDGNFRRADMRDFHFDARYDAVLCLFGSIGYVRDLEGVRSALGCMREHLNDVGLVIVEPWLTPESAIDDYRDSRTVEGDGVRLTRNAHTVLEGRTSRIEFEYVVETADETRHAKEIHVLGLFTVEEMQRCFDQAGLRAQHDDEGLMGRGLYVARPKA